MPIDPFFGTLLASSLGFLGGALDDEETNQRRRSFTDSPLTDPRQLLAEAVTNSRTIGAGLAERAKKPIQLRSRAVSSVGRPSSIDPATFAQPGLDIGALFGQPRSANPAGPRGTTEEGSTGPIGTETRRRVPRREQL